MIPAFGGEGHGPTPDGTHGSSGAGRDRSEWITYTPSDDLEEAVTFEVPPNVSDEGMTWIHRTFWRLMDAAFDEVGAQTGLSVVRYPRRP